MAKCVICLKDHDQHLVCLREKGSKGIHDARKVYINEFSIKTNCFIEISSR